MFDMVHEYLYLVESKMSETEIIYYVATELGIKDKVAQYDYVNNIFDDFSLELDTDIINDMVKFELEHSLKEQLVYLNVKKIMMNQLFSSTPCDIYEIIGEDKKKKSKSDSKTKIIKLNKKKNN
jgi:hypothetical protein